MSLDFLPDHERWWRVHPDLWSYHVDLPLLGASVGRRTVALRRGDGSWALLSPVPLPDAARRELEAEAPVGALVAPTGFHNRFLGKSCGLFPDAQVFLARGMQVAGLDGERQRRLPTDWEDGTEALALDGMKRGHEVVFVHAASRTLVVSDLLFHFDGRYPWGTRLLFRIGGGYPGVRISRLFRAQIEDRAAFAASLDRVLAHDWDAVLMSHGTPLESGGHAALAGLRSRL